MLEADQSDFGGQPGYLGAQARCPDAACQSMSGVQIEHHWFQLKVIHLCIARCCKASPRPLSILQVLDDDWQAKQNIVHTWAMLARNRAGVVAALEASFTDVVINLTKLALKGLNSGKWQLEMCRTCVEFLVQLSHDEEGKAAILEAKAIPTLAALLLVKDEKTVLSTVNALMGITVAPEGKVPTVQVYHSGLCDVAMQHAANARQTSCIGNGSCAA